MDRKDLSALIREFVAGGCGLESFTWDGFLSCRHTDKLVDATSVIASTIGVMCPPDSENEWCSQEGRRRLLVLADAVSLE